MNQNTVKREVRKPKAKKKSFELIIREKTLEHIQQQVMDVLKSEGDTSDKIKQLLKLKMPLEVAKILHIPAKEVFDEIDTLNADEVKDIKEAFANNRLNISSNIKALKGIGKSYGQALKVIEKKINGGLAIELAQVFYSMGEYDRAIRVMNLVLHDNKVSQKVKDRVSSEKINLNEEIKAVQIREAYGKYQTKPSFDSLCKQYNVRTGFLLNILGMEPRTK